MKWKLTMVVALGLSLGALGLVVVTSRSNRSDVQVRSATRTLPFPYENDAVAGVVRRSGGPYVSPEQVRISVSESSNRGIGAFKCPDGTCRIISTFFERYDSAQAAHPDWQVANGAASDREVYLVSVLGKITFTPKAAGSGVVEADHWNVTIDATSGALLGGGTAGTPLTG